MFSAILALLSMPFTDLSRLRGIQFKPLSKIAFFIFVANFLLLILLIINIILSPHNPYQEKNSAFECGFHSFLGQNRTQFSISFFIFALLFLLFDLEILLIYPYIVSAYSNGIYGLIIMLIFFFILRSEEHTSELQSLTNLVCRLLLEKKKNK